MHSCSALHAQDWGQSFFQLGGEPDPRHLAQNQHTRTRSAACCSLCLCSFYALTFGQTPVYSPLATNVHSQPYRSTCGLRQPLERITAPLTHHRSIHNLPFDSMEKRTVAAAQDIGEPKLTYSDHGLHTITTAPQPCALPWQDQSRFMPQGVSSREKEPRRHRVQPRQPTFTRSGIHQVTLSVGQFATTPSLCGCPHFAGGLSPASHVSSSDYMLCGNVHGGMQHDFIGSTLAQIGAQAQGFGDSTTHTQMSAACSKIGDGLQYLRHHLQLPQQRARDTQINFSKSGVSHRASQVQQFQDSQLCVWQERLGTITRATSATAPHACRCPQCILRPTMARGTHDSIYNTHGNLHSTHRSTWQERHNSRSLGKYKYSGDSISTAWTPAACASIRISPRSQQQCFPDLQVRARQERISIIMRAISAKSCKCKHTSSCATIGQTSAAQLGNDNGPTCRQP